MLLLLCLAYTRARGFRSWRVANQFDNHSVPVQLPPGVDDVVVGAGGYPRAVMLANGEWLICVGMQVVSSTDGVTFSKVGTVRTDTRKGRNLYSFYSTMMHPVS